MSNRLKVSTACNNCRRRKTKCDGRYPTCGPCTAREEIQCLYSRERDHRRNRSTLPPSRSLPSGITKISSSNKSQSTPSPHSAAGSCQRESGSSSSHFVELATASEVQSTRSFGTSRSILKANAPRSTDTGGSLIGDSPMDTDFFGGSSASSFLKQINLAIDARLGQSQMTTSNPDNALSPRSSRNDANFDSRPELKDPQSYTLPTRRLGDSLLQAYYDLVWATFPIHDRTIFQESYEAAWLGTTSTIPDRTLYCLVNLVFALGSQFSEVIEPNQRKEVGQMFWDRASKLFGAPSDDYACVERVQCMLLMGLYLQSTCEIYECWMITGSAVRMAQSLGLHLPTAHNLSRRETQMARKAWHGCVYQDRVLSMTFGRPSMITKGLPEPTPLPIMLDDEFLDAESQPAPIRPDGSITIIAFFVKSLELFEIVNDIQYEIYQPPKDPTNREINRLISVLQLDNRLVQWAQSLPAHLGYNTTDQEEGLVFRRQRVVLRARYLYARISVLRPVLSDWYLKQTSPSPSQHRTERSLSQPLVEECATLCFETAHEMIDVLFSNFNFDTVTGPVPAWWFGVLFIYTAATVLLVELLSPECLVSDSCTGNKAWDRAIDLLKAYSRVSQSAQRCKAALEILLSKIRSTHPNFPHEGADKEGPALGSLQPGTLDDIHLPVDFGGADFDIDDMFWLNAPATDFLF